MKFQTKTLTQRERDRQDDMPTIASRYIHRNLDRCFSDAKLPTTARRSGAAAIELAILLPFLGLMFMIVLDFGRVYYATQTLEESAYAAALYSSGTAQTTASPGSIVAAQNAACANGANLVPPLQSTNVTVTNANGTSTVTIQYQFQLITPMLGSGTTISLTRTVTIPIAPVPGN